MTPLILITGFLGSGKTSLLRELLPHLIKARIRPHVILNDYANAEVDSATLRDLVPDIQPISGSCVCCNSMDDLLGTLMDLQLGERDVVLVEANGTTDPLPLLEVFLLTQLRRRFPCLLQIALIDAKRWQRRGTADELERMQARTASHMLFTWTDAAAKGRQLDVRNAVKKLNPRAVQTDVESLAREIIALVSMNGATAPPTFVTWPRRAASGASPFALPPPPGSLRTGRTGSKPPLFFSPLLKGHKHAKHALAHRFRAIQLEVPRGLRPLQLVAWLESLPPSVIRAKGIVQFTGEPGRYHYFQRVEDTVSFNDLFIEPPDGLTLALLVGIGLDEPALLAAANKFLSAERRTSLEVDAR